MGIHKLRLTVAAALGLTLAAGSGWAIAARTDSPSLTDARVCGSERWNYSLEECSADQRDNLAGADEYECSVHYNAEGPTSFEARLVYEGEVQRSYTATLSGSGTQAIGIRFGSLATEAAVPPDCFPAATTAASSSSADSRPLSTSRAMAQTRRCWRRSCARPR